MTAAPASSRATDGTRSLLSPLPPQPATPRTAVASRTAGTRARIPPWSHLGLALIGQEGDLPVALEHGPADILERADRGQARLRADVVDRHALAVEVALQEFAVGDQHHGVALEHRAQGAEAVAQP